MKQHKNKQNILTRWNNWLKRHQWIALMADMPSKAMKKNHPQLVEINHYISTFFAIVCDVLVICFMLLITVPLWIKYFSTFDKIIITWTLIMVILESKPIHKIIHYVTVHVYRASHNNILCAIMSLIYSTLKVIVLLGGLLSMLMSIIIVLALLIRHPRILLFIYNL